MVLFSKIRISQAAIRDALSGVFTPDRHVTALLGPRPEFSPVNNYSHGQAMEDLRNVSQIQEYKNDLDQLRQNGHRHGIRLINLLGVIICIICEYLGAVLVVDSLGYENPEKIILSVCLAFFIIAITHKFFHSDNIRDDKGKLKLKRFFYFCVYIMLIAAIAMSRRIQEETSWWEITITTAMTVGPAWMASFLLKRFHDGSNFRQNEKQLLRLIRDSERKYNGATELARSIAKQQSERDKESAQLIAIYNSVHERTAKRRK